MAINKQLEFAEQSDLDYARDQMARWRAWADDQKRSRNGLEPKGVKFSTYRPKPHVPGACCVCGTAVMVRPYSKAKALQEGRGLYCLECRREKRWRSGEER